MRLFLLVLLAALAATPATALADDEGYAPPDRAGPPLSVPAQQIAAAMTCSKGVDRAKRAPVLLAPGTGASAKDNFGWNYERAFDARGIPWCDITFPYDGNGDIQVNGEYMAYAIRTMYARAGRRIAIAGHSQGGMVGRWALRFWPDTRRMVDDVIGFAPSNHGSTQANTTCRGSCIVANWQQEYMSHFIRALNSFGETFSGISYTNVYSQNDEVATPNLDDTGTSSLHTGGGRIANVAIQQICPNDRAEHFTVGSIDNTAYALAIDALDHAGPADPSRISPTVCAQPLMPGVDPVTGPAAGLQALIDDENSTGPETTSEPPLACYVFAACRIAAGTGPKASCGSTRTLRFRLHAGRRGRIVEVAVYVDGRRVRHRSGRRLRNVSLGRLRRGNHVIRIVTRASTGARHVSVRRQHGCRVGKPRTRRVR